jgi:hypothetical protein
MKRQYTLRGEERKDARGSERARKEEPATLKAYVPESWFHPLGIFKVRKRLEPRLPDVSGSLFLTLTFDRTLFAGPLEAFEAGRDRIRRVFHTLRSGVIWEGKRVQIDAPYCVKVEFHKDGWAHFHIILLSRRFLPGALLNHLWSYGRCNVKRIDNEHFRYLLKYVSKGGEPPDWAMGMRRMRIFQSTKGFLLPVADGKPDDEEDQGKGESAPEEETEDDPPQEESRRRAPDHLTIGQRLEKWGRMAVLVQGEVFSHLQLQLPFRELFDHLVLTVARDGRYLGNGKIQIHQKWQLLPWFSKQLPI